MHAYAAHCHHAVGHLTTRYEMRDAEFHHDLQLSRPKVAAFWLEVLVRQLHLSQPDHWGTAARGSLCALWWFVWHHTQHAVPRWLWPQLTSGLRRARMQLTNLCAAGNQATTARGRVKELQGLAALCDLRLWLAPARADGEPAGTWLSCDPTPMGLTFPADSVVAQSDIALRAVRPITLYVARLQKCTAQNSLAIEVTLSICQAVLQGKGGVYTCTCQQVCCCRPL